jgi:hypothetical protein
MAFIDLKRFGAFLKRLLQKSMQNPEEVRQGLGDALKVISFIEANSGETKLTRSAKKTIGQILQGLDLVEWLP